MLITKKVLISDVILRVTQGKPSSELELEQEQVAFILDQVRWALVTAKVNQNIINRYPVDPVYTQTEEALVPALTPTTGTPEQNKVSIQLQYNPLSLYRDRGIMRVFANPVQPTADLPSTQFPIDYGSQVDMISIQELDNLRNLRFSKPSLGNIKFRREGRTLYLYGLNQDTYQMVTFDVSYFPRISLLEDLNDDDPVPLTEDVYGPLIEEATKVVYQQIYKSGSDVSSDATQNMAPIQVNK